MVYVLPIFLLTHRYFPYMYEYEVYTLQFF